MIENKISDMVNEYNEKYPNRRVTLDALKNVKTRLIVGSNVTFKHNTVPQNPPYPAGLQAGHCCIIDNNVTITSNLCIGDFVHVAPNVMIGGGSAHTVSIGNFSGLAANSQLYTHSDTPKDAFTIFPEQFNIPKGTFGDIVIGKYVAIGLGSHMMPNQNIPDGVFIGAGSFVPINYEFNNWTVYIPDASGKLKKTRERTPEEKQSVLQQTKQCLELLKICLAIEQLPVQSK